MSFNTNAEKYPSRSLDRYFRVGFKLLCWSLGLLYLYAVLYLVFLPDDGNHEDSRSAWCEEYHPHLSFNECAEVAGW